MSGARTARLVSRLAVATLAVALGACGPSPPEPEEPCMHEGQAFEDDDIVQGQRAGDLVEPHFGTFPGELTYSDGGKSTLTLLVTEDPKDSITVWNVHRCRARDIGRDAFIRFATEDGILDHELRGYVHTKFPGGSVESVLYAASLEEADWGEALARRLPVDPSRYVDSFLYFDLRWPTGSPPLDGDVLFSGSVATAPDLRDEIVVATMSF